MTQLELTKILLNIAALDTSKDSLLTVLLDDANHEIMDYCNLTDNQTNPYPDMLAAKITIIKFNRLGSQGLDSQSFSGNSESFTDGYSKDILNQLNRYRKIKSC